MSAGGCITNARSHRLGLAAVPATGSSSRPFLVLPPSRPSSWPIRKELKSSSSGHSSDDPWHYDTLEIDLVTGRLDHVAYASFAIALQVHRNRFLIDSHIDSLFFLGKTGLLCHTEDDCAPNPFMPEPFAIRLVPSMVLVCARVPIQFYGRRVRSRFPLRARWTLCQYSAVVFHSRFHRPS